MILFDPATSQPEFESRMRKEKQLRCNKCSSTKIISFLDRGNEVIKCLKCGRDLSKVVRK